VAASPLDAPKRTKVSNQDQLKTSKRQNKVPMKGSATALVTTEVKKKVWLESS
jgi:hypothetical protein